MWTKFKKGFNGIKISSRSKIEKYISDEPRDDLIELREKLQQEIASADDIDDVQRLNKLKLLLQSKPHKNFRSSANELTPVKAELDPFLTEASNFPIIFSVLCHAVDFVDGAVEEEVTVVTSELNPLTPPEHDDTTPDATTEIGLKQLQTAVRALPAVMSDIDHYAFTLPYGVTACASSYDCRRVICCGRSDGVTSMVDLWNKSKVDLRSHAGPVFATTFLNSSNMALTGGRDRSIRLWNLNKFLEDPSEAISMDCIYKSHTGHVTGLAAASPFDFYFASVSEDQSARLWCVERADSLRIFAGHLDTVNCVAFHPNSNYLVTGSDDRTLRLWDINSGKCQRVLAQLAKCDVTYPVSVNTVSISPNGKEVAAGYDDGVIRVFDIAQAQIKSELCVREPIVQVRYNEDGSLLASIADKELRIWNDTTELTRIKPKFDTENYLSSLTWEGVGNISLISA